MSEPTVSEPPISAEACLAVVEIGGTGVKIGFAAGGEPLDDTRTFPTTLIRSPDPVGAIARLLAEATAAIGVRSGRAVVTVPGFIDRDFDHVLHAANVPELNGLALATRLREALGIPVRLERDVVLQLLGECRAGCARGEPHVLGVYLGTGIGAAYVGEGEVFRGGGWALELGHIPMHGAGRALPGLRTDSLEVYASGRTLAALAQEHDLPVAELFRRAASHAGLAAALDAVVRDQAFAIAGAVAILSPRIVVLGGGIVDMADYPRERLLAHIRAHQPLPEALQRLDLRWAHLGWKAAIHGALGLARG